MNFDLKEQLLTLSNDTSFIMQAMVRIIENEKAIQDTELCGLLNYIREINDRHYRLINDESLNA